MKNKKEKNICINFKLNISSLSEKKRNIIFILFVVIIHKVISKNNEIKIKVNTVGTQNVLNTDFTYAPAEAFINDTKVEIVSKYSINVISTNDIIKLSWNQNIDDCSFMFHRLNNIISVDLSDFESSSVTNMEGMFSHCLYLKYINFSDFTTSEVTNMKSMFEDCENLESLDLSHFKTNKVEFMNQMFSCCHQLKYLDFRNINISSITNLDLMFHHCISLIYIDLSNLNKEMPAHSINSMFDEAAQNFSVCIKAYENIPSIMEELKNLGVKNICEKNNAEKCSIKELQEGKCILNYINENQTIEDLEQEKLDSIKEQLTGENFDTSEIDRGNDIVISNEEAGTTISISSSDNQKMYRNKNITSINLGKCEDKLRGKYNIPEHASLYILKIDVDQKGMDLPKIEYEVYYPLYNANLIKLDLDVCKDTKVEFIYPSSMKGNMDLFNASSGYFNDICYTFTTDKNTDLSLKERQKDFVEKNKTKCEELCDFKELDEINQKVICACEVKINLPFIKEIKFDKVKLYDKFVDINNFVNLQLLKCYYVVFTKEGISKNIGCFILIPILVLFIICIIKFYKNDYKQLKMKINEIIYAKNNIKKLKSKKNNFVQFKKEVNPIQKKNKNSLMKKRNKSAVSRIKKTEKKNSAINLDKISTKWDAKSTDVKKRKNKRVNNSFQTDIIETKKSINLDMSFRSNKIIPKLSKKSIKSNSNPIKKSLKQNNKINKNIIISQGLSKSNLKSFETTNEKNFNEFQNEEIIKKFSKMSKADKIKAINDILSFNDLEMNVLSYDQALEIDGRSYCSHYFSLLRTKNLLIFSFWPNEKDYNSRIIKIYLFFFTFTTYYIVNAFFFDESTFEQINEDDGHFNFIYQIPQILYSTLISSVINALVKYLALSEQHIVELKQIKTNMILTKKSKRVFKLLHYKFLLFFIICSILLLFFWYYLACFGAIYRNTQLHLLKDSIISFSFSLLYPFGYFLVPGIFRIPSLIKKNRKCLYNFSKFIQALL